jgi:hypothetical protein
LVAQAVDRLAGELPKSGVSQEPSFELFVLSVEKEIRNLRNWGSGTGYPFIADFPTIRDIVEQDYVSLVACSVARLCAWKRGVSLPLFLKVFIKREPHRKAKIDSETWRNIKAFPADFLLAQRVLYGDLVDCYIQSWSRESFPLCPGMGSTDDDNCVLANKYRHIMHPGVTPLSTDVSNWDADVKKWLHDAAFEALLRSRNPSPSWEKIMRCCEQQKASPYLVAPNGWVFSLIQEYTVLSGDFLTAILNSMERAILADVAELSANGRTCGRFTMGDDCVEESVDAERKLDAYATLGFAIKVAQVDGDFEFCSHDHDLSVDGRAVYCNLAKSLYNMLSSPYEEGCLHQYYELLRHNSSEQRESILSIMTRADWLPVESLDAARVIFRL